MKITQKADYYADYFDNKQRDNGKWFVCLKDNAPKELQDAIHDAHGDRLPDDWIYGTFDDLLEKINEYDHETIDDLENDRSEIVDSQVDIYTHDLTGWLHENNSNLSYLEDAMVDRHFVKEGSAWQVLAYAQYLAIDEVMSHVMSLLNTDHD